MTVMPVFYIWSDTELVMLIFAVQLWHLFRSSAPPELLCSGICILSILPYLRLLCLSRASHGLERTRKL